MEDVWSYFLEFQDERFKLEGRDLVVGRSRTCDVVVKDPSVSRRHVQVTPRSGRIVLTDLGSSNGTFVNGERVVGGRELDDGDVLGLGDADLTIRIVPKAAFETLRMPKAAIPQAAPKAGAAGGAPHPDPRAGVADGGSPAPGDLSFGDVLGDSDVRHSLPDVGEATGILQAESLGLAHEALRDASEDPGDKPAARSEAPGSHMAPPSPSANFAAPPAASEPEPDFELEFDDDAPVFTTQVLPTVTPAAPSIELPELPEAEAPAAPPASDPPPIFTQPIATLDPSSLIEDPKLTQPLPAIDPPARAESPRADRAPAADPPARVKGPLVTQPLPAIDTAAAEEPSPARPSPMAAEPAGAASAVTDVREATSLPAPPSVEEGPPAEGAGGSELLPSLEGFDTTLGPGMPLPESMQRARENVAQARTQPDEAAAAPSPYRQPALQAPPMAGFWIRASAALLDGVGGAALAAAGWLTLGKLGSMVAGALAVIVILGGWTIWGTTPGKRMLGLYVYTADGQAGLGLGRAALRLAAYLVSLAPVGIGFLMVLSSSKRGLHDRIAGTYVRHYR